MSALVRRRCLDSVSGPGFALSRSLLCQHLRSAGAPPGSSRRFCTEHDEDPLRGVSAPGVLAERFAFLWLEGGLLLHLGGLVPGCCTSGARTESVSAGADGCTDSRSVK